jgi:WD40 repeat protein
VTPTPHLFSILPDGNYLAYFACLTKYCELNVLSLAGEYQGTLSKKALPVGSISPDQRLLAFSDADGLLRILDFKMNELVPFETLDEECFDADWSPDGNYVVASCHGEEVEEIYAFSLLDGTGIRLTDCESSDNDCRGPVWSPDGKWIAYYRAAWYLKAETRGLYLIDTACFANPATCTDAVLGPLDDAYPESWSLDGLYLAASDDYTIRIFKMEAGNISQVRDIETGDDLVETIAWSPNGEWLAYTASSQIYLISTEDWTPFLLYDVETTTPKIVDWITIPAWEE